MATSLYSGVGEFIPIPFIDQYFTDNRQATLVASILDRRRVKYDAAVPQILAEGGIRTCCGCCGTLVKTCCLWPWEKCFKTCCFYLTVRRAVLTVCETYLLARFCHSPLLDRFIPGTITTTTPGSLFRKAKTNTTVDPDSDARTPTIATADAAAWARAFGKAVRHLDGRLARDGVRHIYQVMQQRKKNKKKKKRTKKDDNNNNNNNNDDDENSDGNVSSTDIGQAMERESPGLLAEFDAYMAKALAAPTRRK